MTIKLVKQGAEKAELRLVGRLDSVTVLEAGDLMIHVCDEYTGITLNLAELDYISSAGLRVLLTMQKKMNASGGELAITNASAAVREVFEMTGFSSILRVV